MVKYHNHAHLPMSQTTRPFLTAGKVVANEQPVAVELRMVYIHRPPPCHSNELSWLRGHKPYLALPSTTTSVPTASTQTSTHSSTGSAQKVPDSFQDCPYDKTGCYDIDCDYVHKVTPTLSCKYDPCCTKRDKCKLQHPRNPQDLADLRVRKD